MDLGDTYKPSHLRTSYDYAPIPLFACSFARMVLPRDVDNDLEREKEKEREDWRRGTFKCENKHVGCILLTADKKFGSKRGWPRCLLKRSIIPPLICNKCGGQPASDKGLAMLNNVSCCNAQRTFLPFDCPSVKTETRFFCLHGLQKSLLQ